MSAMQTAPDMWQRMSLDGNHCYYWNLLLDTALNFALPSIILCVVMVVGRFQGTLALGHVVHGCPEPGQFSIPSDSAQHQSFYCIERLVSRFQCHGSEMSRN